MRVPVLVPMGPAVKIPVRYVRALEAEAFGTFCPEDLVIRVSKARNLSSKQVWETVWHELAHAALWVSGWGRALTDEQEEGVVTALEFAIAPFMVFNPAAKGVRWRDVAFPFEAE
ncbi:MAG: hypothetical protein V4750_02825 [Pseudomonadota bacterium]